MSIIENKFEKIYLRDEFIDMRDGGTPLFKDRYAPFGVFRVSKMAMSSGAF